MPRRSGRPTNLPLDELYPCRPQDPYALSKVFGEQLADSCTRYSDITVASLRFSGVNFDPTYGELPRALGPTPGSGWERSGATWTRATRPSPVAWRWRGPLSGHEVFNIAAPTSRYPEPTEELVRRFIPDTQVKEGYSGPLGGP